MHTYMGVRVYGCLVHRSECACYNSLPSTTRQGYHAHNAWHPLLLQCSCVCVCVCVWFQQPDPC